MLWPCRVLHRFCLHRALRRGISAGWILLIDMKLFLTDYCDNVLNLGRGIGQAGWLCISVWSWVLWSPNSACWYLAFIIIAFDICRDCFAHYIRLPSGAHWTTMDGIYIILDDLYKEPHDSLLCSPGSPDVCLWKWRGPYLIYYYLLYFMYKQNFENEHQLIWITKLGTTAKGWKNCTLDSACQESTSMKEIK